MISSTDPSRSPSSLDRLVQAWQARFTGGLSPAALWLAYFDWLLHLSNSPGSQARLIEQAWRDAMVLTAYTAKSVDPQTPPCAQPRPQDRRFSSADWHSFPFNLFSQGFLLTEQWWQSATTGISGVSHHHENVVSFTARQLLDMVAPSNFVLTNPEVLQATIKEGGANLVRGALEFLEDWQRALTGQKPPAVETFEVGKTVAVTPGKVSSTVIG